MRVIAGEAKGYTLKWPKEPHIRPTADLVRGAIFSALESLPVDWSRVLDLYAGTGALGIEALSRGAEEVDFVERNARCCSIIKENLQHTGLAERGRVYRLEARRALRVLKERYSLIFMDPPYSDMAGQAILKEVADSSLVEKQATIVLEHSRKSAPDAECGTFRMARNLSHGDTCVSIFQRRGIEN